MEEFAIGAPHGLRIVGLSLTPHFLTVRLELPGLSATTDIAASYVDGFDELVAYFADLADHWRGWTGSKTYQSLERDLTLTAQHIGHVVVRVQLRGNEMDPSPWRAEGEFRLDPGEELSHVVEQLRDSLS